MNITKVFYSENYETGFHQLPHKLNQTQLRDLSRILTSTNYVDSISFIILNLDTMQRCEVSYYPSRN